MGRSTQEVEIKLPYATASAAREALARAGAAQRSRREFEDNVIFDREDGSLERADFALRVRTRGAQSTLTLKTPVAGVHRHKVRAEHETTVGDADATTRVLQSLGYVPCWRYQKFRTVYSLGEVEICLDETPIGCFVELEGPAERIDAVARELGYPEERYVLCSYRELQERRGAPPGDLLLEPSADPDR